MKARTRKESRAAEIYSGEVRDHLRELARPLCTKASEKGPVERKEGGVHLKEPNPEPEPVVRNETRANRLRALVKSHGFENLAEGLTKPTLHIP
jgi:hypothetical protein